jgi:7-cyano-7-deazaguanine synthase
MPRRSPPTFKSVVLLSGGLDSAVNLALASRHQPPVLALTFDYGHRAARAEIRAARDLCKMFNATHRVVPLPWLKPLTPPALVTRGARLPTRTGDVSAVWVPNRNGVFIAVGAAVAEAHGAGVVVAGFNAEEAASFPDNSSAFIRAANRALRFSTRRRVRLTSYTGRLDKKATVARGVAARVPFRLIYPCYAEGPRPCGQCVSCRRTYRALMANDLGAEAANFAPRP